MSIDLSLFSTPNLNCVVTVCVASQWSFQSFWCSSRRLLRTSETPSPAPLPHAAIDNVAGDSIADEIHGDAQVLHVAITHLIVEEEHLGKEKASLRPEFLEVGSFVVWKDL